MTSPKLSRASSGYGGRGYADIFASGGTLPSVTTVTGVFDKPGIRMWERQQVAAYAVTHVEELLTKSEDVGFRYLQAVPKFPTPEKADEINVYNAAEFALSDAAETGTWMHKYVEDDLNGDFTDQPYRDDQAEMVEAYLNWKSSVDMQVISTEQTVFGQAGGHGFAGTADLFAVLDGVPTCIDVKTSRRVQDAHIMQLAALGAAHTSAVEVAEGTEGAVYHKLQPKVSAEHGGQVDSWWRPEAVPDFGAYAVLQIRPSDWTTKGEYIEPFCKLHYIPQAQIDAGFELFSAGLAARVAQRNLKNAQKEEERF